GRTPRKRRWVAHTGTQAPPNPDSPRVSPAGRRSAGTAIGVFFARRLRLPAPDPAERLLRRRVTWPELQRAAILRRRVAESVRMKPLDQQSQPVVVRCRILLRLGRELELPL